MKRLIAALLITFALLATSAPTQLAVADLGDFELPGSDKTINILNLIFGEEVNTVSPNGIITNYTVLQYLIFPFLSLWVVIYGILDVLAVFRRYLGVNAIVAFLTVLLLGDAGWFVIIVSTIFTMLSFWGPSVFAAIMVVGIFMLIRTHLYSWRLSLGLSRDRVEYLIRTRRASDIKKVIRMYRDRIKYLKTLPPTPEVKATIRNLIKRIKELEREKSES